jgi:hypothetical protein
MPSRAINLVETVLSFGLNRVIARLGVSLKYRKYLWLAIALNEIRGLTVVWQVVQSLWS